MVSGVFGVVGDSRPVPLEGTTDINEDMPGTRVTWDVPFFLAPLKR